MKVFKNAPSGNLVMLKDWEDVEIFPPKSIRSDGTLVAATTVHTVIVSFRDGKCEITTPFGFYRMTKTGKLKKVKGKDA